MSDPESFLLICYVSSSTHVFSKEELKDLLAHAQVKNAERGVTGVLLFSGGTFMQILEGPEKVVEDLYFKVNQDRRHKGLMRLLRRRGNRRYFAGWSMACREMTADERESMGDYAHLLAEEEAGYYEEILPDWILRLVTEFRRINR